MRHIADGAALSPAALLLGEAVRASVARHGVPWIEDQRQRLPPQRKQRRPRWTGQLLQHQKRVGQQRVEELVDQQDRQRPPARPSDAVGLAGLDVIGEFVGLPVIAIHARPGSRPSRRSPRWIAGQSGHHADDQRPGDDDCGAGPTGPVVRRGDPVLGVGDDENHSVVTIERSSLGQIDPKVTTSLTIPANTSGTARRRRGSSRTTKKPRSSACSPTGAVLRMIYAEQCRIHRAPSRARSGRRHRCRSWTCPSSAPTSTCGSPARPALMAPMMKMVPAGAASRTPRSAAVNFGHAGTRSSRRPR